MTRTRGLCAKCHRLLLIDRPYPNGLCVECRQASVLPMEGRARPLPVPREQDLTLDVDSATEAFLRQAHVEVMDITRDGRLVVKIKHWAKKPYTVTHACP